MHQAVCIKQILDPEIPAADFRLDPSGQRAAPGSASLVISIFDENALEVGLQLRERLGHGKMTALSLGPPTAVDALRKALSVRVDEAFLVREEDFPALDTHAAARVLAAAIRRLQPPVDLVLCGRESGDWQGGQLGAFLAAELDFAYVSFVASISQEAEKNTLRMRRQSDEGWEVIDCQLPAVATITNDEGNQPRIPKVKDNMLAFRKTIPAWGAADLGVQPGALDQPHAELESVKLYIPVADRQCDIISGENAEEKAAELAQRLTSLQVL